MARDRPLPAARGAVSRAGASAAALAAAALAASAAGCDAQADRHYPGEPLVTIHGQVAGVAPLPPLEAAILWQRGPPPSVDDQELATRAPVESGFPATFTLRLYQPPPAAARRRLRAGEVEFARGNAAAVPYGVAAAAVAALPAPGNPYGADVAHWLVYLAAEVPAASLTAWWLGAALPAGYHLVRVEAIDPACLPPEELDACVAALVALGLPDDGTQDPGTARAFCLAPYRLSPAPPDELVVLTLGTYAPPAAGGACP
jgi:hypothetical protein